MPSCSMQASVLCFTAFFLVFFSGTRSIFLMFSHLFGYDGQCNRCFRTDGADIPKRHRFPTGNALLDPSSFGAPFLIFGGSEEAGCVGR